MARQDDYVRSQLRLPPDVHHRIVQQAREHNRSLNGEIVWLLQRAVGSPDASTADPNDPMSILGTMTPSMRSQAVAVLRALADQK